MNEEVAALHERLVAEGVDRPVGPFNAWEPVNSAMIRHWCEAMGDKNPIYLDDQAARDNGREGRVAPPTMMQVWTMRSVEDAWGPGSDNAEPFAMFTMLDDAGYPGVVAVNCEQEYFKEAEIGAQIHHTSRIESISPEKTTALGTGFFITELSEYFNHKQERLGTMRFRVFKYRPHASNTKAPGDKPAERPQKPQRMRPVRNWDTDFFWAGAESGELHIQHCQSCDTLRHPPSPMCPHCQSLEWDTVKSSGRGTVYSFVVMHYPPIPPFEYPNPIALVELEEGTRLITQLDGVSEKEIRIGMPVEVFFKEVEDGLTLPLFRPVVEG